MSTQMIIREVNDMPVGQRGDNLESLFGIMRNILVESGKERKARNSAEGTIYILKQGDTDLYKIGFTKRNPQIRCKQLQIGNGMPLHIVAELKGNKNLEQQLHEKYAYVRVVSAGNEWFKLNATLIQNIKDQITQA